MAFEAGVLLAVWVLVPAGGAAASPTPTPEAAKPAPRQRFQLFPELSLPSLRLGDIAHAPERISIRQPGDPDSLVSPGSPSATQELKLLPAFEINDILLKAYTPDALLDPRDNRVRAAGAYSPLDEHRRPYQFRLGARLVW